MTSGMNRKFSLTITSCRHHTWQGRLSYSGTVYLFESELELLLLMDHLLGGTEHPPQCVFQEEPL
jgi:hypothetical protein